MHNFFFDRVICATHENGACLVLSAWLPQDPLFYAYDIMISWNDVCVLTSFVVCPFCSWVCGLHRVAWHFIFVCVCGPRRGCLPSIWRSFGIICYHFWPAGSGGTNQLRHRMNTYNAFKSSIWTRTGNHNAMCMSKVPFRLQTNQKPC